MLYKTIMLYDIVKNVEEARKRFDSMVNQAIKEGYEPVGGVSFQIRRSPNYYYCDFALGVIKK